MRIIITEKQLELLKQVILEERCLLEERRDWINERLKFNPIGNKPNLSSYRRCVHPTNRNITQYKKVDSGELVWEYRSSSSSGSEYYQTRLGEDIPHGKKKIIRCSNHWSYYLCPRFNVQNIVTGMNDAVTCIFGTEKPIGDNFYTILLPERYRQQITQDMVREAMRHGNTTQYTIRGNKYVRLNRLTCNLLDNVVLCGEVFVDENDNSIFFGE